MQTPFAIYDALASIEVPPEKVRVVVQSMEHDMALFASRSQFDQLDQFSGSRHDLLRGELAAFSKRVDERFDRIDERFERVNATFGQVNATIAALATRTDDRFDRLSDTIENRLFVRLGQLIVATVGVATALLGTLVTVLATLF